MTELRRLDGVTAGRVEVAIIFMEMLGVNDAAVYLAGSGVPQSVSDRVLADTPKRRSSDDAIVSDCLRDPDFARRTVPEKRVAPARQRRAAAFQSMPFATSSAIPMRKWTKTRRRIAS